MIYHPLTSKGTSGQHFIFHDNGPNDEKENRKDIVVISNSSPNGKRSTSVKNSNQVKIMKDQQLMMKQ